MNEPPHPPDTQPSRPRPAAIRWLEKAELATGAVLLAVIFALILIQATQRHLPVAGWVWTGELARFSLVWLAFSLAGYLIGRDEHITLKLVDFVARGRLLRAVWIFANAVVAAVAITLVAEAVELVFGPSPQTTPALEIPLAWTYVIPMVGLVLVALRALGNTLLPAPPAMEARTEEPAP